MTEEQLSETSAPYERMMQVESKHIIYSFCTLCSLLENKKLSLGNIFLLLAENEGYQSLYKEMLSEDDLIDALKQFLILEPSIMSNRQVKLILSTWR